VRHTGLTNLGRSGPRKRVTVTPLPQAAAAALPNASPFLSANSKKVVGLTSNSWWVERSTCDSIPPFSRSSTCLSEHRQTPAEYRELSTPVGARSEIPGRSAPSFRSPAKCDQQLRAYYGVADHVHIDILDCLKRGTIWTVNGPRKLNFLVRSDDEMGRSDASTISSKDVVTIAVKESVRCANFVGVGRARNTLAHELGHGVMHEGPPMHRRSDVNVSPTWLQPFESAEHQARVFAPAFLINDTVANTLESAEELSITFGLIPDFKDHDS
jgi:hypothetical protein